MLAFTHYFDINAVAGDVATTPILARLFGITHAIRQRQTATFAVALPGMHMGRVPHPGNQLRLFAAAQSELDAAAEALEANPFVRDYARLSRVRRVPKDFAGGWVEYQRYRIPGRGSRLTESRARRLRDGNELPFLHSRSQSTAQAFSIRVRRIEHAVAPQLESIPQPDAYGLSLPTRPFAVPLLTEPY